MRLSRVVGVCAVGAIVACAGVAEAGPRGKQRVWQAAPIAQRAHAIRMATFTKVNGQIVLTSEWIDRPAAGAGSPDTTVEPAFDCYEGDPASAPGLNVPSGFLTCGSNAANFPGAQAASRWYSGPTWIQPRTFNDMTLAQGFNGTDATRVSWSWNNPQLPGNLFIAISSYEDFGTVCQFPATPGFIEGVIFEFLGTGGAWYADEDLTTGPTPLTIGMPADGSGAYEVEFYSDSTATTLVTMAGIQPFYWGTGEDEWTPEARAGTQDINEFDDDTAPFGGAYGATECYNLTAATNQCPSVLGAMIEFWAKGDGCYADCNGDGTLTVQDFGCFQTKFVAGDPYADCNGDANLTVQDFGCFQTQFVSGCP